MKRHLIATVAFATISGFLSVAETRAQPPMAGQQAYGYQWAHSYNSHDWNRLYITRMSGIRRTIMRTGT